MGVMAGLWLAELRRFSCLAGSPFLLSGLAPFTAGILLAKLVEGISAPLGLIVLSYIGLTVIMLATYYSNEYFDYEGDVINKWHNKFSGGSRALSDGYLPREVGRKALVGSLLILAVLTALYTVKYSYTRVWIPLYVLLGFVLGVFYSGPPFRWAYRGVGEIFIAMAYGILAVTSGYYIATGHITIESLLLSMPAALSIFSVIIINEIPDYEADVRISKRNLVVRLGRERALKVYSASNVLTILSTAIAAYSLSGPTGLAVASLIVLVIGFPITLNALSMRVLQDSALLEKTCAQTILLNALAPFTPLLVLLL